MISKAELLGVFEAHANNIHLVRTLQVIARATDLHLALRSVIEMLNKNPVGLQKPLQLLADRPKLLHSVDQLHLTIVRTVITEVFELTKDYCYTTGQIKALNEQPWFDVLRMCRNTFNHNFQFKFNKKDQKMLPIEWSGIQIDATLEGKQISLSIFSLAAAMEWLEELEVFVSTKLQ